MAEYVRIFAIPDVAVTHERFAQVFALAEANLRIERSLKLPPTSEATLIAVRRAYGEFNRRLDEAAKQTAVRAQSEMRTLLTATSTRRPPTGNHPNLRGALTARALRTSRVATGTVGVADVGRLNALVNPRGPQYGPYWIAQEYGSRRMVGRTIYGAFFGPGGVGDPSAPSQSEFRHHPIFKTSAQAGREARQAGDTYAHGFYGMGRKSGKGGRSRMRIRRPIKARHFIEGGADLAESFWRSEIASIQSETYAALLRITP